jgi:hypothetical protein
VSTLDLTDHIALRELLDQGQASQWQGSRIYRMQFMVEAL